jgi:hypothetical protein
MPGSTASKEMIKMDQQNSTEEIAVSINKQVAVGAVLLGLWMLGVQRKLGTINSNQKVLYSACGVGFAELEDRLYALSQEQVSVKDVIRLAATTIETKES